MIDNTLPPQSKQWPIRIPLLKYEYTTPEGTIVQSLFIDTPRHQILANFGSAMSLNLSGRIRVKERPLGKGHKYQGGQSPWRR